MSSSPTLFSNGANPPEGERLGRDEARRRGRAKADEKRKAAEAAAALDGGAPPAEPVLPDLAPAKPPAKTVRGGRDLLDGKAEYKLVAIDDLIEDPDNPRKTFRNVIELAESLKQAGMLQPIVARLDKDGHLIVQWGARRLRAAKHLQWSHVPVIIRYGVKDSDVLARQLAENSHRMDLDPIEEARGIRALMRQEKLSTYKLAAERLGHAQSWVTNRMSLLSLDPEIQDQVSNREISIIKAAEISRRSTGTTRTSIKRPADYKLPHFSDEHPLASRARARCRAGGRSGHTPKLGDVACGSCWEDVIRIDALVGK